MADSTKTNEYLKRFSVGEVTPSGILPFRPPKAPHRLDRELYGLVEFPINVLLQVYREVFSPFDRWRYQDNLQTTDIYIRDKYPVMADGQSERTELKPAIVTERGTITPENINGRGNNRQVAGDKRLVTFKDKLSVPMTVHCLAELGPEAARIASVIFGVMKIDEEVFKQRGVDHILGLSLGEEIVYSPQDSPVITLADVPVRFTLQYSWGWARLPDGPGLESLASLDVGDP